MPFMLMPTLSCTITTYTEIASFSLIQFPTYVDLELAGQALEHDVWQISLGSQMLDCWLPLFDSHL